MKIFLFGGAEVNLGQVVPELKLIEKVLKKLKPKQILHIPFARTKLKNLLILSASRLAQKFLVNILEQPKKTAKAI